MENNEELKSLKDNIDLSLVPLEDIKAELNRRFDSIVVLGSKDLGKEDIYEFFHKGNNMTVLGLVEQFSFMIKNNNSMFNTEGFYED